MYLKFKVILLLIALWRHDVFCSLHEPPSNEKVLIGYHGKNVGKLDETHQFQISTVYDTNVSMKTLNERDISYLKSVVDEALLPFSSLQIKHEPLTFLNYTFTLNLQSDDVSFGGNCTIPTCGSMKVPVEYLGSCMIGNTIKEPEGIGAKAHFILFVSVGTMVKKCDKKGVYSIAAHCQQGHMDRPIAGYIDICKDKVVGRKLRSQELTHDILHTLAFSQSLYPFFHDANGEPRTSRNNKNNLPPMESSFFVASDSTIKNVSINWLTAYGSIMRNMTMLVTETALKQSRTHFGCNDLEGAVLEDGAGIPGFAMSHFEKRVFKNEIMSGTHNDEVIAETYTEQYVFSNLTLAVLQDSGWYIVNYTAAQHLPYAHKAGCKFVRSSCLEWAKTRCSDCFNPYCDELKNPSAFYLSFGSSLKKSCSPNRKGIMSCDLHDYMYPPVEPIFRYMSSYDLYRDGGAYVGLASTITGPDELFDHCPLYHNFLWERRFSTDKYESKCDNVANNKREYAVNLYWHEIYGEKSKCFDIGEPWVRQGCGSSKVPLKQLSGACYKYKCYKNMLYIGVKWEKIVQYYQCAKKGQVISIYRRIRYHRGVASGSIVCPDCSEFCNDCVSKNFKSLKEFERFEKKIGDDPIDPCLEEDEGAIDETTIYSNIKLDCSYTTHLNIFYSLVLTLIMLL